MPQRQRSQRIAVGCASMYKVAAADASIACRGLFSVRDFAATLLQHDMCVGASGAERIHAHGQRTIARSSGVGSVGTSRR